MLDCAMMTAIYMWKTHNNNNENNKKKNVKWIREHEQDECCWHMYRQTNIVKMNDNRWFQYDNDDNVCEKIFSFEC